MITSWISIPSCKISSRSDKGFRFCACAISRIKLFTRLFVRFLGSSDHLQPKRPHGFWRKIRQKTRFPARMCLIWVAKSKPSSMSSLYVTFFGSSEDFCLLRWRKSIICQTRCFGKYISITFAKKFYVFVPNVISHYEKPSRFALIRFNARRLDYSASLLVPHNLESWINHPKESELNLTCFVVSLS